MDFVGNGEQVKDIPLAYDMACAEDEFRVLGKLARVAFDQAPAHPYCSHNNQILYYHPTWNSDRRLIRYFDERADYASSLILAESMGKDRPRFRGVNSRVDVSTNDKLAVVDNRRKVLLFDKLVWIADRNGDTGLSSRELLVMKNEAQIAVNRADLERTRERSHQTIIARNRDLLGNMVNSDLQHHEQVSEDLLQLVQEADKLEIINLVDGPIRKGDLVPMAYELIAKFGHDLLRDMDTEGAIDNSPTAAPTRHWKKNEIKKVAESLIDKFNGTVTNFSVLKLPITNQWLDENFTDDFRDEVYADSIQRLRFIAELSSTGKQKAYSQVEYGMYVRRPDDIRGPAIVATTRKINRMSAAAVQESLIQESTAVANVVASKNAQQVIHAGLPTLGKR